MPKLDKIKDADLRSRLEEANGHLRKGKSTEAVQSLADTFVDMIKNHPEMLESTSPGRRGRRVSTVTRWPNLGANLSMESVREGAPKIEFKRDKFAMSEAITYYEFTVDTAIQQGL